MKRKIILVIAIETIILSILFYVIIKNSYIPAKYTKWLKQDIPKGYFVRIYGAEENSFTKRFDYSHVNLFLFVKKDCIEVITYSSVENIGSQAGILEQYGYQEKKQFKTLDDLISYVDQFSISMVGAVNPYCIPNEEIKKFVIDNGSTVSDGYILHEEDFTKLLEKIYENF